ncbi:MAG: hypothetical protein UW37_C0035G0002 [Candidatus Gottesmanbacteria bacterium GW2011_GWA2_44_17]|uniref:Uncharacterized protein n=1 Tax=Candidatus Gottesmanbacteria bacterium GW2011_GWA2_44_17 TaxID=1618444 RepID=A0A0G1HHF2_9BACT|nr:MAG: hypothetical protein UV63_C0023G0005 [Microgenomates group bacterium GW2011_GWC1_43_11]KKT45988.1 MAG: hypothetical protein UW37_C0035G0002 [Candidatus Gottesmanbacteria bacterium GW2011_GWA2_44_17]HCM82001.1 hypothetical protein [Patescibacteria group bacterium]
MFPVLLATTKPLPLGIMNKDALLATFIGFVVGLVVTGLVLYGPGLTKNFPKIQFPKFSFSLPKFSKATPTPTSTATDTKKEHTVTIESPLADAIEQEDKVLVSGATSTSSIVVISGPVDEVVIEANGDGKYAGKVTVSEGKNDITVTSFLQSQAVATQTVSVFYTPEEWQ